MKPEINRYTVWVAPSGRVFTAEDIKNAEEVLVFKNQSEEDIFNLRMKYPAGEFTRQQTSFGPNKPMRAPEPRRKEWKDEAPRTTVKRAPAPSIAPKPSDYSDVVNTMMEKVS